MKTIRFDCNGRNSPAYGCSKPGDNSGEYVPADVAQGLYDALESMMPERTGYGMSMDWQSYSLAVKKARAAVAKAQGESNEPT